jgi:hypothetical protein
MMLGLKNPRMSLLSRGRRRTGVEAIGEEAVQSVLAGELAGGLNRPRYTDERELMSSTQAAVVLGASGSVGKALMKELIRNGSFRPIVAVVRRSQAR